MPANARKHKSFQLYYGLYHGLYYGCTMVVLWLFYGFYRKYGSGQQVGRSVGKWASGYVGGWACAGI